MDELGRAIAQELPRLINIAGSLAFLAICVWFLKDR